MRVLSVLVLTASLWIAGSGLCSARAVAAAPDATKTFTLRINGEPETLDWNKAHTPIETYVLMNIMEGLVSFDSSLKAIPSLAQKDAGATVAVNVTGTANMLAALEPIAGAHFIFASSADVYGVPEHAPVDEDAPLQPTNVYAESKVAAEKLVRAFGDRGGHPTVILRPANTNGSRQHPGLAASGFAKQIAEAEIGQAPAVIRHGRLDSKRDFIDVRDIAAAYVAAIGLAPARTETYNVGSGEAVSIERILQILVGLARVPVTSELDPERVRPGDATVLALDASAFRARTGWSPRIPLERSLADLLDYWRTTVARAAVPAR